MAYLAAVGSTAISAAGLVPRRLTPAAVRCFSSAAPAVSNTKQNASLMSGNRMGEDRFVAATQQEVVEGIEEQLKAGSIRTPADLSAAFSALVGVRRRSFDVTSDTRPTPVARGLGSLAASMMESPDLVVEDYLEILRACSSACARMGVMAGMSFKRAADAAFKVAETNQFTLDVDAVANLIHLVLRGEVKSLRLTSFIREQIKAVEHSLTNHTARRVLGVQNLHMFDKESLSILSRALSVGIDDMKNRDVVSNVLFLSRGIISNRELLNKCTELLDHHSSLFETRELLWCARGLDVIGGHRKVVSKLCGELLKKSRSMGAGQAAALLRILINFPRPFASSVSELLAQMIPVAEKPWTKLTICDAILACKLEERKDVLNRIVTELLQDEAATRKLAPRLVDVVGGCELFFGMKFNIPDQVQSRLEMHCARVSGRYLYQLKNLQFPESCGLKLEIPNGPVVGRFTPALVDENKRVVIEADDGILTRSIRQSAYQAAGYACLLISEPNMRRLKRNPEKLALKLDAQFVRLGTLDNETFRLRYGLPAENSEQ